MRLYKCIFLTVLDASHLPNSHTLLDIGWSHLVTQVHHKLGKLLHIDDVLWILRVCIDDLGTSSRTRKQPISQNFDRVVRQQKMLKAIRIDYTVAVK